MPFWRVRFWVFTGIESSGKLQETASGNTQECIQSVRKMISVNLLKQRDPRGCIFATIHDRTPYRLKPETSIGPGKLNSCLPPLRVIWFVRKGPFDIPSKVAGQGVLRSEHRSDRRKRFSPPLFANKSSKSLVTNCEFQLLPYKWKRSNARALSSFRHY